jgi:hypothetical protein
MTTTTAIKTITDLKAARAGSFYTILGAGGDLNEWVEGYEKMLAEQGIGKPTRWFKTTGGRINKLRRTELGSEIKANDEFPDDLTVLLFPLDGLNIGKLAIFKLEMQDRWFDDVLDNMNGCLR